MARAQLAMGGLGTLTQTVFSVGVFYFCGIGPCRPPPPLSNLSEPEASLRDSKVREKIAQKWAARA